MRARIKKRWISFSLLTLSLLALVFAFGTYWFPIQYITPNYLILAIKSRLVTLNLPLGDGTNYGFDWFKIDIGSSKDIAADFSLGIFEDVPLG